MESIEIKDINISTNVRMDMGDITELTESLKINGMVTPVIIDEQNRLIDGYRRIEAAKKAGMVAVPFVKRVSGIDRSVEQLIHGIMTKKLTPHEEATTFLKLNEKFSVEDLAKQLGKTQDYIKRRLLLLKLKKNVAEALDKKKIHIGHAELISQLSRDQQDITLDFVIDNDLTVQNLADHLYFMDIDFSGHEFRTSDEKKDKTLFDTIGEYLNPEFVQEDTLSDNEKFNKDLVRYLERERKRLRDAGLKVFNSPEELDKVWPHNERIGRWDNDYDKALANITDNEKYAVVLELDTGYNAEIDKEIYKKLAPPKPKKKSKEENIEKVEAGEEILRSDPKERLDKKVENYAHQLLESINPKYINTTKQAKVMAIYQLVNSYQWDNYEEFKDLFKDVKRWTDWNTGRGYYLTVIPKIFKYTEKELDELLLKVIKKEYVHDKSFHEAREIASITDMDLTKEFQCDEDYLKMYTKDQLLELAQEFGLSGDSLTRLNNKKKGELIEVVLELWESGMVPKILQEKIQGGKDNA